MTLLELLRQELPKRGGRYEVSLRPLHTEAERAIDEMVRLSGVSIGAAKILYDAGYRKR